MFKLVKKRSKDTPVRQEAQRLLTTEKYTLPLTAENFHFVAGYCPSTLFSHDKSEIIGPISGDTHPLARDRVERLEHSAATSYPSSRYPTQTDYTIRNWRLAATAALKDGRIKALSPSQLKLLAEYCGGKLPTLPDPIPA